MQIYTMIKNDRKIENFTHPILFFAGSAFQSILAPILSQYSFMREMALYPSLSLIEKLALFGGTSIRATISTASDSFISSPSKFTRKSSILFLEDKITFVIVRIVEKIIIHPLKDRFLFGLIFL